MADNCLSESQPYQLGDLRVADAVRCYAGLYPLFIEKKELDIVHDSRPERPVTVGLRYIVPESAYFDREEKVIT